MTDNTIEHHASAPDYVAYRIDYGYEARQRVLDIAIASGALLVSSPVLLIAAAFIWLEDGGPVFFTQKRVGRFGKVFTIIKLRTMRVAASVDALAPTTSADDRLTRIGRILRKASIDELPQLINVLRGDMAIVGPRPEMPFIVSNYRHWQHLRHLAKPGLTGLWQTTVRKTVPLHTTAATAIDITYLRNASTVFDGKLVLKTFGVLLSTSGAF